MSNPVGKQKPREQIITARRIAFRRSLNNPSQFSTGTNDQPKRTVQQVISVREKKSPTIRLERNLDKQRISWNGCQQKTHAEKSTRDFRAYQNGDLHQFFDETAARRVSDVCLVNDHFILVKMPQTTAERSATEIECLIEHVENKPVVHNPSQVVPVRNGKPQRHRRVQPVTTQELRSVISVPVQMVKSVNNTSKVPAALRHIRWKQQIEEESLENQSANTQNSSIISITNNQPHKSINKLNFAEGKSISRDFDSSVHERVEIQRQGSIVYCNENMEANMNVKSKCDNTELDKHLPVQKESKIRALHWLITPFCERFKRRKRPKTKPKIQAVIYKTYFVRWSKPTEMNWRKSANNVQNSGELGFFHLRRIRSAVF